MSGKLYVVGTPIGNLGDVSERMAKTLREVDFIVAEDTRVTSKLLGTLGIQKPMLSYNGYNKHGRDPQIAERLISGESCAIVSDAGMPCISDPGVELVAHCRELGIEVESVPGPSAVTAALSICGKYTGRFIFEGFLPVNRKNKLARLCEVKDLPHTLVYYEAPHKLPTTLRDMLEVLGDRRISIVREITKIYEESIDTTISKAIELYEEKSPKGEFVVIVEGKAEEEKGNITIKEASEMAKEIMAGGKSASEAAKETAGVTGLKKGDIYRAVTRE